MGAPGLLIAALVANPLILGATTGGPDDLARFLHSQSGNDAQAEVAADADRDSRLTIPVMLEGQGPYRFMVDTGSQSTVVSRDLAGKLALADGPVVTVVGVAGRGPVGTARLGRLSYARRDITGLTVPVLEGRHLGADGILGTDCLRDQRVLFDFRRNLITVGPAAEDPADGFEIVVRARSKAGRLIITDATIDGVRTRVIVDSGASGTIGNRALQRVLAHRRSAKALPGAQVASVTGQTLPVDFGVARKLSIGSVGLANLPIAYADAPAFAELGLSNRPAILLGISEMRAFKRVAIDFASHKVLFDLPDATR